MVNVVSWFDSVAIFSTLSTIEHLLPLFLIQLKDEVSLYNTFPVCFIVLYSATIVPRSST